jgi:hypothetical protein
MLLTPVLAHLVSETIPARNELFSDRCRSADSGRKSVKGLQLR